MRIRKGVSAIIFFEKNNKREYLLLKRKLNWRGWEFLKGGKKKNETEGACLNREIKEEIGAQVFESKKTRYFHEFKYVREYLKDNLAWDGAKNRIYFVRLFNKKIKLDKDEHSNFKWFNEKEVLKKLTWKDYRNVFKKLIRR